MVNVSIEAQTSEQAALLERIDKGKHSHEDLATLRKMIQEQPGQLSKVADLCDLAFREAMLLAGGENALFAELLVGRREVLRAELGYAEALPVERSLIDEVAICWLRRYQAECRYAQAQKGRMSLAQADHWQRRLGARQRRYLRSIETLVRVGKLLRSVTVQLNIAQQQLNVAAGNVTVPKGGGPGPR